MKSFNYALKRVVDIVISLCGLIVFSPLLVILYILIRFNMGSPVIFKQPRPGYKGKIFNVYKLRTMSDKRDIHGELLPDSKRLTKLGEVIRKLSLDEIPQLFNVLKGDMSLVGPRPLLVKYLPYYREDERRRFAVRPGITGWAQVNGRNTVSWDSRFAYDVWYVENFSILLDIKILWMTLLKVFKSEGVVVDANSVMKNLDEERKISL